MVCERCLSDVPVERHVIDGFDGYLCGRCREAWGRLTDARGDVARPTDRGSRSPGPF